MEPFLAVVDEVALDGLEGCALDKLWEHLSKRRPPFPWPLDTETKVHVWHDLACDPSIEFFDTSPCPSGKLQTSKNQVANPSKKTKGLQPECEPTSKYVSVPVGFVYDAHRNLYGYCPGYDTRKNVTNQIRSSMMECCCSLDEALQRWGSNLRVVASQDLRNKALADPSAELIMEPGDVRFFILEHIGKGRWDGALQRDFIEYQLDPRTSFHYLKDLTTFGYITRQTKNLVGFSKTVTTNIVLLKRFHSVNSSFMDTYCRALCKILSEAPDNTVESNKMSKMIGNYRAFKGARRWLYEHGYIQILQSGVAYSDGDLDMMPRTCPGNPVYLKLVHAYNGVKDDKSEGGNGTAGGDAADDGDADATISMPANCISCHPLFLIGCTLQSQCNFFLELCGSRGTSTGEATRYFQCPSSMCRSFLRQAEASKIAKSVYIHDGRQRRQRVLSIRHTEQSAVVQQLNDEAKKSMELIMQKHLVPPHQVRPSSADSVYPSSHMQMNTEVKVYALPDDEKDIPLIRIVPEEDHDRNSCDLSQQEEERPDRDHMTPSSVTATLLRRQNYVLSTLKQLGIVDNLLSWFKKLLEKEAAEGVHGVCCKKTFLRVIDGLVKKDQVRVYRETVTVARQKQKEVVIYYDAALHESSEMVQVAIARAKDRIENQILKQSDPKPDIKKSNALALDALKQEALAVTEEDQIEEQDQLNESTKNCQRRFGFMQRFPRLRLLHLYLWQLTYGGKSTHGEGVNSSSEDFSFANSRILGQHPWLGHVVPQTVPIHGPGWFEVETAIASMPLVVFAKCLGVRKPVRGLEELLRDPVMQCKPLKDLPPRIQFGLLKSKKYQSTFMDEMVWFCMMGILEASESFLCCKRLEMPLYISTRVFIYDTSISLPGYTMTRLPDGISEFTRISFELGSLLDVDKYWSDLQNIARRTPLGVCRFPRGKGYPRIKDALQTSRTIASFRELMTVYGRVQNKGEPIGDRMGACGLDSSLFLHFSRNWIVPTSSTRPQDRRRKISMESKTKRIQLKVAMTMNSSCGVKQKSPKLTRETRVRWPDSKRHKRQMPPKGRRFNQLMDARTRKNEFITQSHRRLTTRPSTRSSNRSKHVEAVDQVDREALLRKRLQRVSFSTREDSLILLGVMAIMLAKEDFKSYQPWVILRDMMMEILPESCDKTTASIRRRWNYLRKDKQQIVYIKFCVAEFSRQKELSESTCGIPESTENGALRSLMTEVIQKYKYQVDFSAKVLFPESYKSLVKNFVLRQPVGTEIKSDISKDSSALLPVHLVEVFLMIILQEQLLPNYEPSAVYHLLDRFNPEHTRAALRSLQTRNILVKVKSSDRNTIAPLSTVMLARSKSYQKLFQSQFHQLIPKEISEFARFLNREESQYEGEDLDQNQADPRRHLGLDHAAMFSLSHVNGGEILYCTSRLFSGQAFAALTLPQTLIVTGVKESTDLRANTARTLPKSFVSRLNRVNPLSKISTCAENTSVDPPSKKRRLCDTDSSSGVEDGTTVETLSTRQTPVFTFSQSSKAFPDPRSRPAFFSTCPRKFSQDPMFYVPSPDHSRISKPFHYKGVMTISRKYVLYNRTSGSNVISLNPASVTFSNGLQPFRDLWEEGEVCSRVPDIPEQFKSDTHSQTPYFPLGESTFCWSKFQADASTYFRLSQAQIDLAEKIFKFVQSGGVIGVEESSLQAQFASSWKNVPGILSLMLTWGLIIRDGHFQLRYISGEHLRSWLIPANVPLTRYGSHTVSQKSLAGDRSGEDSYVDPSASTKYCYSDRGPQCSTVLSPGGPDWSNLESPSSEGQSALELRGGSGGRQDQVPHGDRAPSSWIRCSSHGPAIYIDAVNEGVVQMFTRSRPWMTLAGEIDQNMAAQLLRRLALLVVEKPGILQSMVLHHFLFTIKPAHILLALEVLIDTGCISRHYIPPQPKPCLFASFTPPSSGDPCMPQRVGDPSNMPTVYYLPTMTTVIDMETVLGELGLGDSGSKLAHCPAEPEPCAQPPPLVPLPGSHTPVFSGHDETGRPLA